MEELKEYSVTVKSKDFLDSFYDDLETPGGSDTIPDREVTCSLRKPISQTTHYLLTVDEARALENDERVSGIQSKEYIDSLIFVKDFIQESDNYDKGAGNASNDINWALLRCVEGQNRYAWGADGVPSQTGIVTTTSTGRNVDVIIVDDIVDPNHPELAVNSDGTGGSRVIQYNWLQHNPAVRGESVETYDYTLNSDDAHGTHVAGTVAGNTQGWARNANIYNINYSSSGQPTPYLAVDIFEYILEFHKAKPINPATGYKNPTIVNNSWGIVFASQRHQETDPSKVEKIYYRGNFITGPFTDEQLESYGCMDFTSSGGLYGYGQVYTGAFLNGVREAMDACYDAGIVITASAGNNREKIVNFGDVFAVDRDNAYAGWARDPRDGVHKYQVYYQWSHGNCINNGSAQPITVGATNSAVTEAKRSFSACGPSVEVYAPGTNIMSSYRSSGVNDPRNSNFKMKKLNGTSMSCPQVTGILACLLEAYPHVSTKTGGSKFAMSTNFYGELIYSTKYESSVYENGEFVPGPGWIFEGVYDSDIFDWMLEYWGRDQLLDTGGSYTDENSLQGGANLYATYIQTRDLEGTPTPATKNWIRPSSGNVWPRNKLKRYGVD